MANECVNGTESGIRVVTESRGTVVFLNMIKAIHRITSRGSQSQHVVHHKVDHKRRGRAHHQSSGERHSQHLRGSSLFVLRQIWRSRAQTEAARPDEPVGEAHDGIDQQRQFPGKHQRFDAEHKQRDERQPADGRRQ